MPIARLTRKEQALIYRVAVERVRETSNSRPARNTGEAILNAIATVATWWPRVLKTGTLLPSEMSAIEDALEFKKQYKRIRQTYLQMKSRKFVMTERRGDNAVIKLTEKGRLRLLRASLRNQHQKLPKNEVLLVAFDIPEDARVLRSALRSFLKQADFKILQKSIWQTEFDVEKELNALIRELKVDDWVTVIRGRVMNGKTTK